MKGRTIEISILSIIFLVLVICWTGCIFESRVSDEKNESGITEQSDTNQPEFTGTGGMDLILEQLEKEGYDVSEIRTAIEKGDRETARTLMEQYMENAP